MLENLGDKLKILRVNQKLSRKQVAERIGVSLSMVGLYETGERQPSLTAIVKLASLYKVSVDYLLGCELPLKDTLSLEGLDDKQVKALKLTVDCFRSHSSCQSV